MKVKDKMFFGEKEEKTREEKEMPGKEVNGNG